MGVGPKIHHRKRNSNEDDSRPNLKRKLQTGFLSINITTSCSQLPPFIAHCCKNQPVPVILMPWKYKIVSWESWFLGVLYIYSETFIPQIYNLAKFLIAINSRNKRWYLLDEAIKRIILVLDNIKISRSYIIIRGPS